MFDAAKSKLVILKLSADAYRSQVNRHVDTLVEALELKRQELLRVVKEREIPQIRNFDFLRQVLSTAFNQIENGLDLFEKVQLLHQAKETCNENFGFITQPLSLSSFHKPAAETARNWTSLKQPVSIFGTRGNGLGQLNAPVGLALTLDGDLVASEWYNNRIQVFGQDGSHRFSFGSKGVENGQFYCPRGVAVDSDGRIIVADRDNHRVQIFGPDGSFINRTEGDLNGPEGVAVGRDNRILVADKGNHEIVIFSKEGQRLRSFGTNGNGNGQFDSPIGVATTMDGRIVVCDRNNGRVQIFNADGEFESLFSCHTDGSVRYSPYYVAATRDGHLIVSESDTFSWLAPKKCRICAYNMKGQFMHQFGSKGNGNGKFDRPLGIVVSDNNTLFVSDCDNHRIQCTLLWG